MENKKVLIICGSPRKGNTEFVLKKVFDSLTGEKELVLLREKNIKRCAGCLLCDKTKKCALQDDMAEILEKMEKANTIIIGSPVYYDNVSGLAKDFMDRTNPFYETGKLKDKKVVAVVVGGGEVETNKFVADTIIKNFAAANEMVLKDYFCFKALKNSDLENNPDAEKEIEKIVDVIGGSNK